MTTSESPNEQTPNKFASLLREDAENLSDMPKCDLINVADGMRRSADHIEHLQCENDSLFDDIHAQAERIAQLILALHLIVDDPVLDSDTQRLLRAHVVARAALKIIDAARTREAQDEGKKHG